MKKIFLSLLFFCALSNTALAQDKVQEKKSKDPVYLAKTELAELVKEIPLESSLENGLISLLTYKHETLAKATTDTERNQVYETMKSKIDGSLTPEQLKKLKSNKKLYENFLLTKKGTNQNSRCFSVPSIKSGLFFIILLLLL